MSFDDMLVSRSVYINNVRKIRTFRCTYIFFSCEEFHILFLKAKSGKKTVIIKLLFFQIIVRRPYHNLSGNFKSGKKSYTKAYYCKNSQKSSKALFDFP